MAWSEWRLSARLGFSCGGVLVQYDGQGHRIAKIVRKADGEEVTCERMVSKSAPSGECLRANRYSRFRCGAGGLLSHAFGVHR